MRQNTFSTKRIDTLIVRFARFVFCQWCRPGLFASFCQKRFCTGTNISRGKVSSRSDRPEGSVASVPNRLRLIRSFGQNSPWKSRWRSPNGQLEPQGLLGGYAKREGCLAKGDRGAAAEFTIHLEGRLKAALNGELFELQVVDVLGLVKEAQQRARKELKPMEEIEGLAENEHIELAVCMPGMTEHAEPAAVVAAVANEDDGTAQRWSAFHLDGDDGWLVPEYAPGGKAIAQRAETVLHGSGGAADDLGIQPNAGKLDKIVIVGLPEVDEAASPLGHGAPRFFQLPVTAVAEFQCENVHRSRWQRAEGRVACHVRPLAVDLAQPLQHFVDRAIASSGDDQFSAFACQAFRDLSGMAGIFGEVQIRLGTQGLQLLHDGGGATAAGGGIHDEGGAIGHEGKRRCSETGGRETICQYIDTLGPRGTIPIVNRTVFLLLSLLTGHALAGEPATHRTDVVGTTLNQWIAEGSAAGFKALNYENRDGGHSLLPSDLYGGLTFIQPTEEDKKAGRDKGPAQSIRGVPVIGNCSMAGGAEGVGSLGRAYMTEAQGHAFLFTQYVKNNLFIYPEHQDYDPGANGKGGGWGDLFPANTPALLISQGSSYHDQPFVKALLATAAAFKPEVQNLLIRQGLLAATLQAIFRQSNRQVKNEADYFTGKAHPPVFDKQQIDELKMITLAHLMTPKTIPPLAFVEVLSERQSKAGADYFEPDRIAGEKLGATPINIARVFRSSAEVYSMTLSARRSVDPMKRPLRYRWEILQGNEDWIKIETKNGGQQADVQVRWHAPFASAAGIRTHRVDLGLFVSNEVAASVPAIVSFYMLPNEQRFFDADGRLGEVCYEAGNPELGLPPEATDTHWLAFFSAAGEVDDTLLFESISDSLSRDQRHAFAIAWQALQPLKQAFDRAAADSPEKEVASKALADALSKALRTTAVDKDGHPLSLREAAVAVVSGLAERSDLFLSHQKSILALAAKSTRKTASKALDEELRRLADWKVLEMKDGHWSTTTPRGKFNEADRYYLRQLNLTILGEVLLPEFLDRSPTPLFADPRLTVRKTWRDVYRHDSRGARTSWDRYFQGKIYSFDADGRLQNGGPTPAPVTYKEVAGHLEFEVWRREN